LAPPPGWHFARGLIDTPASMSTATAPVSSPARIGAIATALHLACDFLASRATVTSPPYLLLAYMDEAFREFLNPVGVSIGAALALGAMTASIALAVEGLERRRALVLAGILTGLWAFSGALMLLVYVRPPWGVALGSVAAGLPRMWAIAWVLDRAMPRPAREAS
jgi:hypothetical protein